MPPAKPPATAPRLPKAPDLELVRVTVRLEGYIHAQLVRLARDQKRSVSFVVRRLIIDAVRRHRESQG
jgi:hypothetical protein